MTCFRKAGDRRKKTEFRMKGKQIEIVKSVKYQGYEMKENNKENTQIRNVKAKATCCMGKIWSIEEKRFEDDWEKRMRLFNSLIKGIIMYGVEMRG